MNKRLIILLVILIALLVVFVGRMVVSGVSRYRDIQIARTCADEFFQLLRNEDYEVLASKYRIKDGLSFEALRKRFGNIVDIQFNSASRSLSKMEERGGYNIAYIIENGLGKKHFGIVVVDIALKGSIRKAPQVIKFIITSTSDSLGDREYSEVNISAICPDNEAKNEVGSLGKGEESQL